MSVRAMRMALEAIENSEMSSSAAHVLTTLAWFHNQETGRCDPSISKIAARTKLSKWTIRRAIAELSASKLVAVRERKQRYGGKKNNLTNSYVLCKGWVHHAPRVGAPCTPKDNIAPSAPYDLANLLDLEE